MRPDLVPGATLPDFELPDTFGVPRKLSDLQGDDALILLLGRGEHCPRERQHQREMVKFHEWCAVAFTQLVTVLPNEQPELERMRIATAANWPYLSDARSELQTALDVREYTDTVHNATVPHTLVLGPGLMIDKIYVGYWFWGRPSAFDLWADLRDLFSRTKPDFDPTLPEARAAWEASH